MGSTKTGTAAKHVETIRERLVREEREAQEKRIAEMRAEREARKKAEAEAAEKRRKAEIERREKAEAEAKRRSEQAAADAAARRERNVALRAKEIERLERVYVLFERANLLLDELDAAERDGLNLGVTYHDAVEKLRGSVRYNMNEAKRALLDPSARFSYLGIDD